MKITKLEVKSFRHIYHQTIVCGNNLTVITGQNGTGKSSLLGWFAQSCHFRSNNKTITGKAYQSQYSEIFRFCNEYDYLKKYTVSLIYKESQNGIEETKEMSTRYEKTENRYRVDFDGRGTALDYPLIYLGLKRLIPLATEKNISQKEIQLKEEEVRLFSYLSKKIMILLDKNIASEGIKSTNKDVLAMKTQNYGHLGNSAGQDNIGQIISAMISFKRLKQEQGDLYQGGLLLIDEIDATLYAGSQIHLIKEINKFSKDNNVQVIFTTHSLEILEYLSEQTGNDIKINFLELKNQTISNRINPSVKYITNKIKVQTGQKNKIPKIEIVCEDRTTELWCKNLLSGTDFVKSLNIKEGPFGEGYLSTMAESKHPLFKNVFFVLDGDCRKKYKARKLPPRTILLPETSPPEVVLFNFLRNLTEDDDFWIETDELNYSKQVCFQNYQNEELSTTKRWFIDKDFRPLFGGQYARLFSRWKRDNPQLVSEFQESFRKVIEKYEYIHH